jgi:hypothetical protein
MPLSTWISNSWGKYSMQKAYINIYLHYKKKKNVNSGRFKTVWNKKSRSGFLDGLGKTVHGLGQFFFFSLSDLFLLYIYLIN